MKPPEECANVEDVRKGIDALDRRIVALIGERSRYVSAAARFKTSASSVRAAGRQRAMIEERRGWAKEERLNPEVIEDIYKTLISYFVSREMEDWQNTSPNSP